MKRRALLKLLPLIPFAGPAIAKALAKTPEIGFVYAPYCPRIRETVVLGAPKRATLVLISSRHSYFRESFADAYASFMLRAGHDRVTSFSIRSDEGAWEDLIDKAVAYGDCVIVTLPHEILAKTTSFLMTTADSALRITAYKGESGPSPEEDKHCWNCEVLKQPDGLGEVSLKAYCWHSDGSISSTFVPFSSPFVPCSKC